MGNHPNRNHRIPTQEAFMPLSEGLKRRTVSFGACAFLFMFAADLLRGEAEFEVGTLDSGGSKTTSANYTEFGSISEGFDTASVVSNGRIVKAGFLGQVFHAQSLALSANPAAVVERTSTQLSAVATMDDDTLVRLTGSDAKWSVVNGAITGITNEGVATAGHVFINAPATVRGGWDGVTGDLVLTVLNLNVNPPGNVVTDPVFTPQVFAAN